MVDVLDTRLKQTGLPRTASLHPGSNMTPTQGKGLRRCPGLVAAKLSEKLSGIELGKRRRARRGGAPLRFPPPSPSGERQRPGATQTRGTENLAKRVETDRKNIIKLCLT